METNFAAILILGIVISIVIALSVITTLYELLDDSVHDAPIIGEDGRDRPRRTHRTQRHRTHRPEPSDMDSSWNDPRASDTGPHAES